VPAGTTLDLSATATAVICDRAAAQVHDRLGAGVLVGLGGDAASAGPAPAGGWPVAVTDRTGDLDTRIHLPAGAGISTSHLTARPDPTTHAAPPAARNHLIDPRTGRAPTPVFRMVSAIGFTSLEAATYTAAALVRGTSARGWLTQLWIPARLVTVHDDVIEAGPWASHTISPAEAPVANPRGTTL
jgi:FAD:protein FMN transferase